MRHIQQTHQRNKDPRTITYLYCRLIDADAEPQASLGERSVSLENMPQSVPPDAASFFRGRKIFITGGTGSFGHQIVAALTALPVAEITIFSRDEAKQHEMSLKYVGERRLRFIIGDIRDPVHVTEVMAGSDVVYHAAALKQVPSCEFHPLEAVKTNILGAENVRRAAIENACEVLVAISTDKAVKPVNAYGMSKALQEKLILSPGSRSRDTRMVCVRYGNVVASRGSVIPIFLDLARQRKSLTITNPKMTRFLLTLPDAIQLVIDATMHAVHRTLWVKKMPAATVLDIARSVGLAVHGERDYPVTIVGERLGEKIHEVLVSDEEMRRSRELPSHFVVYPTDIEHGGFGTDPRESGEYSSENTERLDAEAIVPLLRP